MTAERTALITGLTGQDGSFLAEQLLERGYAVTGLVRGEPRESLGAAEHLRGSVALAYGDLLEPYTLRAAVASLGAGEIYHLAAPSFVPASWKLPGETFAAIVGSTAALLEAVRDLDAGARVFVASSGSIFGEAGESPQSERTPCRPTNPYAIAKLAVHQLVGALREHDGVHASSGIAFNHESERRPEQFVTRRITRGAAAIALGHQRELMLGSLDAVRDWSFAGDVMHAAWLMLQQEQAGDYVLASGVGHTVAELAHTAFACVDLDAERYIRVERSRERARESTPNVGDPTKARRLLGWEPSLTFEQLIERMVRADLRALEAEPVAP